ncbi:LOW QUALITY PROTEIN: probable L-gulonolactone oxidase 4 [Beta vulgaris subsp. vulgaris]|uniref:LOW QUALITY PROTEIN: probable L-gulonolactone oxidase 4 n=1 Tax=Beta vulgaris subsp. vulgaris TaxID=3555 RepID=UPI0020368F6C|nr:LOW QUALITY PROTEIN: probable L-gulonolactone oxidase 4 [Beta vulgaris subsp. vulgaris]
MILNFATYDKSYTLLRPFWLILVSYFILYWSDVVTCNPPEEPIKCSSGNSDCTITNGYGSFPDRSICRAANVVYPENEDQLISYVKDATTNKRKIKVATKHGHSYPKLVCPDGEDGLLISTKNLNKIINVNMTEETMTVESGVTLQQLIDEAAKVNLALTSSPYWAGVTVGGMLGTGAHGSSLWGRGSAVHDFVVGLKIVSPGNPEDDYVKVRTLTVGDEDLDAAKVSLGVLGVISQVTFKLEPLFKRSITYITRDDGDLEVQALKFGLQHEFADITWLPSQHKAIYRVDDRVPATTLGDGVYDYILFRSAPQELLESTRKIDDFEESNGCAGLKCTRTKAITANYNEMAFGLTNDGVQFNGYPVIGYQNKMQCSGTCLVSHPNNASTGYCAWDPRIKGIFVDDDASSLPMNKVNNFIQDIKKLVSMEPTSLCGVEPYFGILMRYVKASSAYLGKDEDGIQFDIVHYRAREASGHRLHSDIYDEIEQITAFKYGGMPHWGKNRNVAFEGVINKYKDGGKFLRVKERYDPLELFSSDWTKYILGLKEGLSTINKQVGCAREGLCICSTNKDCGRGYTCENGRVYMEAKVCRRSTSKYITNKCGD